MFLSHTRKTLINNPNQYIMNIDNQITALMYIIGEKWIAHYSQKLTPY